MSKLLSQELRFPNGKFPHCSARNLNVRRTVRTDTGTHLLWAWPALTLPHYELWDLEVDARKQNKIEDSEMRERNQCLYGQGPVGEGAQIHGAGGGGRKGRERLKAITVASKSFFSHL